jgi:hypothetical protein
MILFHEELRILHEMRRRMRLHFVKITNREAGDFRGPTRDQDRCQFTGLSKCPECVPTIKSSERCSPYVVLQALATFTLDRYQTTNQRHQLKS